MLEKYYTKGRKVLTIRNIGRRRRTRGRGTRGKDRRRGTGGRERGTRSPECCAGEKLASFPLNNRNDKRAINCNAFLMTAQIT